MCSNAAAAAADDDDDNDDIANDNIQVSIELGRASAPTQFCIVVSVATRCRHKRAPALYINTLGFINNSSLTRYMPKRALSGCQVRMC